MDLLYEFSLWSFKRNVANEQLCASQNVSLYKLNRTFSASDCCLLINRHIEPLTAANEINILTSLINYESEVCNHEIQSDDISSHRTSHNCVW